MITNIVIAPAGGGIFHVTFQSTDISVASTILVNFGPTASYGQSSANPDTPTSDLFVDFVPGVPSFHFQLEIINNASPYQTEFSSDQIYPAPPIPGSANITTFLRKSNETILIWDVLASGPNGEVTSVSAYNIYRSNNTNLESFDLIAQINATDLNGLVQTVFNEKIVGYFAYGVSGVNATGEGPMTVVSGVDSAFDLDNLN